MNFDVIVIGSGPGGYVAAIRSAQLGLKTGIIEKEALGGICLNWGCIPTKALLKSAQVFNYLKNAKSYGVTVDEQMISPNFPAVIQRSREVAQKMSQGISFLMKKNKIEVIFGTAHIKSGKKILVMKKNGEIMEYTAHHIIIATGACSKPLSHLPKSGKEKIIGYRQALSLSQCPKQMVIIGSGAIGVEFAYFYNEMGTKVILVECLPHITPIEDIEISKQLERSFKKKNIEVLTSSSVKRIDSDSVGKLQVSIQGPEQSYNIESDLVLAAIGIQLNTDNLGLEEVGIKKNKEGRIIVDKFYRTSVEGYYAIGDIVPGPALAHVASAEGIICIEKIKGGLNPQPLDYGNIPSCTYCHPEIASLGLTEKEAKEQGYTLKIGKFPFVSLGKATANGNTEGFVKVIFDAQYGEWLGCHMIGMGVTDMISEVVVARKLETTAHDILTTVHPHPTLSEAIIEATANAYGQCIHL